jgi:hypothetical protein
VKKTGLGVEAAAGRLRSVLVSEPGCGGVGRSFASRQASVSGDLGGPSGRMSNEAGWMVNAQCLPEGSN